MKKDKIIGITFGSFDLCHYGHVLMFEECKQYCDYLIVGVQSDPSIDRPDKNSPIQSHEERLGLVSSIKFVDEVKPYSTESDLIDVLKEVNPDVRILGVDHKGKEFTGHDLPIKCIFNSRDHGYSTSELRKRVVDSEKKKINSSS
ncbi:MAG: adenylyltransferase/cytidyltransferase family protein [bacterium]|jgi:glycerol-3-phosphate cytidylyltransferase|nr:glycerol-3-phosphate cytidylyltransferase [Candidatus Neomarinimicrobiota bacterium]HIL86134.1 glycerol-3-phosphate cytidylyltransferase [Candidatus Neomarinimicrobiota bacterium]